MKFKDLGVVERRPIAKPRDYIIGAGDFESGIHSSLGDNTVVNRLQTAMICRASSGSVSRHWSG